MGHKVRCLEGIGGSFGCLGLCSTTLTQLDASWQLYIPELLQRLAGKIYIDKERLRCIGSLGEGGFAVVEKMELMSEDRKRKETVAVKKLKPGVIEDDEDLKELVEESNLLRRVKHKCISIPLLAHQLCEIGVLLSSRELDALMKRVWSRCVRQSFLQRSL